MDGVVVGDGRSTEYCLMVIPLNLSDEAGWLRCELHGMTVVKGAMRHERRGFVVVEGDLVFCNVPEWAAELLTEA